MNQEGEFEFLSRLKYTCRPTLYCILLLFRGMNCVIISEGYMSLYIQQLPKLISNQLGCLYRYFGSNSDSAAWFLICTSSISQHIHLQPVEKSQDSDSSFCRDNHVTN